MSGFLSRCSSARLFYTKGKLTSDTTCTLKSCEHIVLSASGGTNGSTQAKLLHGGVDSFVIALMMITGAYVQNMCISRLGCSEKAAANKSKRGWVIWQNWCPPCSRIIPLRGSQPTRRVWYRNDCADGFRHRNRGSCAECVRPFCSGAQ
jgi:hypothetical protein